MKTSESIKEIAGALVKAQTEIKAAIKDAANPFFKTKYADLASVIEAVRTPLNKAGISFLQPVSDSENGVMVETVLIHTSGEWLSESLVMPVSKADAQGVGSAITYGRRYGLQSMCGVPSEDDDGNAATKAAPGKLAPVKPMLHKPVDGALEALSPERKNQIADLAIQVREAPSSEDAVIIIDDAALENDEKIALWSLLDSKIRSGIKRAQENRQLATQA